MKPKYYIQIIRYLLSVKPIWGFSTKYHIPFLTTLIGTGLLPMIIMCNGHIQHKLNYSEAFCLFFSPFLNWRKQRVGFQGYVFFLMLVSDWCSHGNQAVNSFLAVASTGLILSFKSMRFFNNTFWEDWCQMIPSHPRGRLGTLLNRFSDSVKY